jgi:hypothetical protein
MIHVGANQFKLRWASNNFGRRFQKPSWSHYEPVQCGLHQSRGGASHDRANSLRLVPKAIERHVGNIGLSGNNCFKDSRSTRTRRCTWLGITSHQDSSTIGQRRFYTTCVGISQRTQNSPTRLFILFHAHNDRPTIDSVESTSLKVP